MTGNGALRVAASYAKYVGAIQETQVSSATQAGTPLILYWYYDGPGATPINADPNGPLLTRAQALTQLFYWFQGQGCPNLSTCQVALGGAQVPGVNQQIRGLPRVAEREGVHGRRPGQLRRRAPRTAWTSCGASTATSTA